MRRYRYRPSKPTAVFSAFVGAGMIVFALTSMHHATAFVAFWCVCVVGIVGLNLWSAFSPRGSVYDIDSDDGPPRRFGMRGEPDTRDDRSLSSSRR